MEQEINGNVQKINDEDYEIIKVIESNGLLKAIEWYKESYECTKKDAIVAVRGIKKKYMVNHDSVYMPDVEDIIAKMDELHEDTGGIPSSTKVADWIMQESGCSRDKANAKVREAMNEAAIITKVSESANNKDCSTGKNGCMITILIAITSTLSVFFLI